MLSFSPPPRRTRPFPLLPFMCRRRLAPNGRFGFDLAAACSAGSFMGCRSADAMLRAGQVSNVLVIGSEVYSRILNFSDRGTCVLFGDGAGAVLLQAQEVTVQ